MARRILLLIGIGLISWCIWSGPAGAGVSPVETGAPPDLEVWKAWVLHGAENELCPTVYNDGQAVRCAWPSRLELNLETKGGRFRQEWLALAKTWIVLPGGPGLWPGQVTLDGQAVPVMSRNGQPAIRVTPGAHRIEGAFDWAEMPETLPVPSASGLIGLAINGRTVDFPILDSAGRLWLQRRAKAEAEAERLEIRIQRLITDSIPMQVTNLIKLSVSGRAREIKLDGLLLKRSIPMSLTSPLPARLSPEGDLKVQVRPGRHDIVIVTRFAGPVGEIGPVKTPFGQEIWTFNSQNHLRLVKIEGPPALDPTQTDIPADWKRWPTYIIDQDAKMNLVETRRGDPDPAPDRLALSRTWWLDFDGRGLTVQDRISGTMSRQWFLAMNPPGVLGRAAVDGADQLITIQAGNKSGVELRRGQLQLTTDSRYQFEGGVIPAVGWDHDFTSVSAELNLPPGWRLLTATGVDVLPGTWFERWTLLDFFLVLIIAIAIFKLTTWRRAFLALVTLVLIFHESGAPQLVWLNLLAALALLRVLPEGWFKKVINLWRVGSIVTLIVIAIPFMVHQVRFGVYPQLEDYNGYGLGPWSLGAPGVGGMAAKAPMPMTSAEPEDGVDYDVSPKSMERATGLMERQEKPAVQQQAQMDSKAFYRRQANMAQDPNALIQTGPGLPQWQWRSVEMKWNGPVDKDQQVHLWLLSPTANLILALLRVILLTMLIMALVDLKRWWQALDKQPKQAATATAAALLLLILQMPGAALAVTPTPNAPPNVKPIQAPKAPQPLNQSAVAGPDAGQDWPDSALLQEFKKRLLEKPDCLPACAHYPRMALTATSDALTILLEVHAAVDTAVPLPGHPEAWMPAQVLLDNKPAPALARAKDGQLWLQAPQGLHTVTLIGPAPTGNSFQLPMTLRPDRVTVTSEAWEIIGVRPDGQVEASLQFNRLKKDGREPSLDEVSQLPPFLRVDRILTLGLTWEVTTTVRRLTPAGTPVVVAVPLLPGESVNTPGLPVKQGQILLTMDARTNEIQWTSTLDEVPDLELTAPLGVPWTETWTLDLSPVWHAQIKGIPVIHHQDTQGQWRPEWRPWPGEKVSLSLTRPKALLGQTLTIDSARLEMTPGERFNKAGLSLSLRASQGGQHKVVLPAGAKLQQVRINERTQPIGQDGPNVVLPLTPGSQKVFLEWHQPTDSDFWLRAPEVKLGHAAVNAEVIFQLPRDRWLLLAGGPRLGPAVLFWSYLAVVILAALALGRIRWTPLKTRHWLLLSLGLTQVHPLLTIIIVGWLLILAWRERKTPVRNWFAFDLTQILLVVWTVVALIGLYTAVERGLLGIPHMQVAGNNSSDFILKWTQDRVADLMPAPWVCSLPRLVYRVLMLLWALWLALSLLKWLRWGWQALGQGGLWKKPAPRPKSGSTGPGGPITQGGPTGPPPLPKSGPSDPSGQSGSAEPGPPAPEDPGDFIIEAVDPSAKGEA